MPDLPEITVDGEPLPVCPHCRRALARPDLPHPVRPADRYSPTCAPADRSPLRFPGASHG